MREVEFPPPVINPTHASERSTDAPRSLSFSRKAALQQGPYQRLISPRISASRSTAQQVANRKPYNTRART